MNNHKDEDLLIAYSSVVELLAILKDQKALLDELLKEQGAMKECLKRKCVICPHCKNCDVGENGLLKEQEAVEPKWFIDAHNPAGAFRCSSCGERIVEKDFDFYCSKCGKPILWEAVERSVK